MANGRQTRWVDMNVFALALPAVNVHVGVDLLTHLPDIDKKGCTVTRMIGKIDVRKTTGSLSEPANVHVGIVRANMGLQGAALPHPSSANQQPGWLWRDYIPVRQEVFNEFGRFSMVEFDLHTQRRLMGEDETITIVFENDADTTQVEVGFLIRTLCLMP